MSASAPPTEQPVPLVAGTHTWLLTPEDAARQEAMVHILRKHGVKTLDTARIYGEGASEATIGDQGLAREFEIVTKAATGFVQGTGKRIVQFGEESLKALRVDKVRTYLLHAADETVPVAEQMEAVQTLYRQGKMSAFGLSNFTKDQVLEFHGYAKAKGYVLPTVYQSSYSLAVRRNETELFPTLRELGMSIQAYSPMAAGLLAKTPEYIEQGRGSWDTATFMGRLLRDLYFKPSYMRMLAEFGRLSEESGVSRSGLAYRWLRYHSLLDARLGDEVIVGAATPPQLEETLAELEKGPLEAWVVERIDALWDLIRADAPVDNSESAKRLIRSSA